MKRSSTLILLLASAFFSFAEADSFYILGENYFHQHLFDSAAACFNKEIQEYPATKEGYYNHGLSMYKTGQFDAAVADFNHSLHLDPQFVDAQFMEAIALERKGDLKAAIAGLERVKAKNSNYDEVGKRIDNERFAVYIAEKWYYMIAIMLLGIILIAIASRLFTFRKW